VLQALNGDALFVYGAEIVPCSRYEVQLVRADCDDPDSADCSSPPLHVETAEWGDVVPDAGTVQPTFRDISAVVEKFKRKTPPLKVHTLLRGDIPPVSTGINFLDISGVVNAYLGKPYPHRGPRACGLVSCNQEWVAPAAIPEPPFGIHETVESVFGDANYFTHYVDNSRSCDDASNSGRGSRVLPRCTIPRNLAAGAVVVVHGGPYTPMVLDLTAVGTALEPVFLRGSGAGEPPVVSTPDLHLDVRYTIVEGLAFMGSRLKGSDSYMDHSALRFSTLRGRPGANAVELNGTNVVLYGNEIHHAGQLAEPDDRHGVTLQPGSRYVWIVDNHIHHNSGDAIQFCHRCEADPPQFVYVGRNVLHDDVENAVDLKACTGVIVSQNEAFGYRAVDRAGTTSDGSAIILGSDGGPDRVWVLFNRIHDSDNAIRVERSGSAWIVGNRIYRIGGFGFGFEKDGLDVHILYNTVVNADVALDQYWRPSFSLHVFNNVFVNMRGVRHGNHVNIELSEVANRSQLSRNLFWQDGGPVIIRWGERYDSYAVHGPADFHTFPGGTANILADPRLRNAAGGDLRLDSHSAAVDMADSTLDDYVGAFCRAYGASLPDCRERLAVDADGEPRPFGQMWDLGADEHVGE
jgi:hypothetical protein